MVSVFFVLFIASIAVFSGLTYGLWRKKNLDFIPWNGLILTFLSFLLIAFGALSERVVLAIIGASLFFADISMLLTSYVRSDHIVKRIFEVALLFLALATIVFGYAITGSPILGIIVSLIATTLFIAFLLSHLLPKMGARLKSMKKNWEPEDEDER
ncbi:MAG: hypothetical protein QXO94_06320 [Candidatus Bathyarchaeia archaeon]